MANIRFHLFRSFPFFLLFFVRHHQSYFTLSPSEKASFCILVFTHSVCLRALIGLSIMHNVTASISSFCLDEEELIVLGFFLPTDVVGLQQHSRGNFI